MIDDKLYAWRIVENQSEFPRKMFRNDREVQHGFAVGVGDRRNGQTWWFFTDREDALTFGELARKSSRASGYGVYPAAQEVKYDEKTNTDVGDKSIDRLGSQVPPGSAEYAGLAKR